MILLIAICRDFSRLHFLENLYYFSESAKGNVLQFFGYFKNLTLNTNISKTSCRVDFRSFFLTDLSFLSKHDFFHNFCAKCIRRKMRVFAAEQLHFNIF